MKENINRFWKHIADTIRDGIVLIGTNGTIVMVNRAFEHLLGYSAGELLGRPCTLMHCDACEGPLKNSPRGWCVLLAEQTEEIRARCQVRRKDGTYVSVLKNASLLRSEDGSVLGAVETLTDLSEMELLDRKIRQLSKNRAEKDGFFGIVGQALVWRSLFDLIPKAAVSDAPVLILGESGTGKELIAKAIHELGLRKSGPFVQVNCSALNASLLESELFGHVKGAFTGAYRHRLGRFEVASGGDLFLDEIGDLPPELQVKLLRVLETRSFERVGDHRPIFTNARIITATNRPLDRMVAEGLFRGDLYFRIKVIPIRVPPLRERPEDIPPLVEYFIRKLRQKTGKKITHVEAAVMQRFLDYPWPGNVRELKYALEYAFVVADRGAIATEHLPILEDRAGPGVSPREPLPRHPEPTERDHLIRILRETRGNQSQAARIMGINRVTVWNRMKKHGIRLNKILDSSLTTS